jgi:hypothetical protein
MTSQEDVDKMSSPPCNTVALPVAAAVRTGALDLVQFRQF